MAKEMKGLKLQFVPYTQLASLSPYKKIKFLIDSVAEDKIIILQGKLSHEEEKDLIEETMKKIGKNKKFKGIEIETLNPKLVDAGLLLKIKKSIADFLVGNRDALTLIGPATIVREVKKDIKKLELFLKLG
ncbi:MAG: DUF2073 domain-containing protein [Candidatus Pacearchaeota archaeon]